MKYAILLALAAVAIVFITAQQTPTLTDKEIEDIAVDAYIYGYPLVTMELTRQVMTNAIVPEGSRAPMGQFCHLRSYPNPEFKEVTTPNADTLYSAAWIDLSKEPYVLHVPEEKDRYYLMPMLSMWTDVFASPGTRTTGNESQDFVLTGPGWTGKVPEGLVEYKSSTNFVWIIGRTYCTGTTEDYRAVHAIQNRYLLTPLSFYGKTYSPPKGVINSHIDMKMPVRTKVNLLSGIEFFNTMMATMKANPPLADDAPMVARMAKIGVVSGGQFDSSKLDPKVAAIFARVPKLAQERIAAYEKTAMTQVNGWAFSLKTGVYGTDYLRRALVALGGLGANIPQDAIYMYATKDNAGKLLVGANEYVIHFDKGQTPPVKGFWSLTMYTPSLFFVENYLDRYTLSPRDPLKYNQDGSLDLYIQNKSPGKEKESNWLPAPADGFVLMLRCYWPEESLLNGKWTPPPVAPNPTSAKP